MRRAALHLFSEQGYDNVTVAQVAQAAGVSHMTFFRHFHSKESVVVGDLFDPVIAAAVAAQPPDLPPLHRAVGGLLAALADPSGRAELESEEFALRIRLVATTPTLRGASWAASQATEDAITAALEGSAADPFACRAAAAALMGAATSLLLAWAAQSDTAAQAPPAWSVLRQGLTTLVDGQARS